VSFKIWFLRFLQQNNADDFILKHVLLLLSRAGWKGEWERLLSAEKCITHALHPLGEAA
jgi:hypothetical protein